MLQDCLSEGDMCEKIFIRNQDVVSRKIAGELFLVPVKGKLADMEQIFTLTSVAEYIWGRIDGQRSLDDIRNDVVGQFDVGQEQAESDIREFVAELEEAGLIRAVKG
jgi:hypothetical protein